MADQLIIFDTTLRDGEQSPGASMTRTVWPVDWLSACVKASIVPLPRP